jgi:hypothetical protein
MNCGTVFTLGAAEAVCHDDGDDIAFDANVALAEDFAVSIPGSQYEPKRIAYACEERRDLARFGGHDAAPDPVAAS